MEIQTRTLENYAENPEKTVVGVNVDTQKGFMDEGRNLYVPGAERPSLRKNMEELTETLREYQLNHTGDYHTPEDEEIVLSEEDVDPSKGKFPPHCMIPEYEEELGLESGGAQHIDETKPENPVYFDWRDGDVEEQLENVKIGSGEPVIYKNKFDTFEGSPHADEVFGIQDPDAAVVYGVTTDICVNAMVQGLQARDIDVYVAEDAIQYLDPDAADGAKREWRDRGAELMETSEILEALEGGSNEY